MASDARLIWGSTALISSLTENDLRAASSPPAYIIQASADGTNFGNPQAVITEIRSHLQDGSLASVTSYDNREGSVTLMVSALTHDALGKAEAALVAETKVPGYSTLSWTPSVTLSVPPTVYDVVWSDLSWQFDDINEIKQSGTSILRRFFTAKFELLPFGHDATPTTMTATSAPVVAPTIVSIADGNTTSGWTASARQTPTTVTSVAGAVVTTDVSQQRVMRFAGTIGVATTRIIFFDVNGDIAGTPAAYANSTSAVAAFSGTQMDFLAKASQPGGFIRFYFQVPASLPTSLTAVSLVVSIVSGGGPTGVMRITQVSRTDFIPALGTNRQRSRSAAIGGSARCRAAIIVTADTGNTLGDLTMVYTRSDTTGLQPPLTPYATATGSANPALISGQSASIGTVAKVFQVPACLFQEALHNMVARTRATTAGTYTLNYAAALKTSAGATVPESTQSLAGSVSVTYPAANTWQTNEVGALQLPTVPVAPDSTHIMEITLQASASVVQLDEAWLFDLDNGVLSWLDTTGLTRLEIRPADLINPEPSYWGGTVDGGPATALIRADYRTVPAISAAQSNGGSFAQHYIEPGTADIFTVTSGTEGSSVTLSYSRSFLHNVSS